MIPKNFVEFYGDQTRWFVGTIVNVADDPLYIGRVKVKIHGVYDEIAEEDLPWAQIVIPVTSGIHEGVGQNLGMLVGTQVFGMFLDGPTSQLPLVMGAIPKMGDANDKTLENYPLNKVYETETGHYKEYDDSPDGRVREEHRSGTFYEMQNDGTLHIHTTKDLNIVTKGDVNITVDGDAKVSAKNVTVRASDKISLSGTVVKLNS